MTARRTLLIAAIATFTLAGFAPARAGDAAKPDAALAAAVHNPHRSAKFVARDTYRHPLAALSFWGLKPGMTVVEIWPFGGYWAEILAPYAKATGGHYIAAQGGEEKLPAKFEDKAIYGDVDETVFNKKAGLGVKAGTADLVLTSRNIHNWMQTPGFAEKAMADFYAALKPGGILAVVEHRSDPRPMKPKARGGYVSTAYVVGIAEKAGFKLEAKSEINANPKDDKNHPYGVWTLPPTLQGPKPGTPGAATFDHAKYKAIGESDRMTLRFRKPR